MQSHMAHKTVSVVRKCASYKKTHFSALIEKVEKLAEENNQTINDRHSQIMAFINLKGIAERNIQSFGREIIKHFDLKEQAILQDLEILALEYKHSIKLHVETCTYLEKSLQNDLDCMNDIQISNFKPDMFATDLIISRRLASNKCDLKYIQSPSLTVRTGEHLISLLTRIQKLGDSLKKATIESRKAVDTNGEESVISASNQAKNATETEINPSQTRVVRPCCKSQHIKHKFVFSLKADDRNIDVQLGTIMNDGQVVLVLLDKNDHYVVLLDKSFNFLGHLNLPSQPFDISTVNESSVIITLPSLKQLQYINVESGQLKPDRILQMDKSYYGVEVLGKTIYATFIEYVEVDEYSSYVDKAEVQILSLDGKIQKRFEYEEGDKGFLTITEPRYLTVDASTERIFVSDIKANTVTCLKPDGTFVFQYKDPKLCYPSEVCACTCNDDFAIAALGCVHIVSHDGKRRDILYLIDKFSNPHYPGKIAYRKQSNTWIFGLYMDGRYCATVNRYKYYRWWSYLW